MLSRLLTPALLVVSTIAAPAAKRTTHNDFSCRSTTHPNPVVLMHGLGATYYEDINELDVYLQAQDYCTFSITYGEFVEEFPYVGGLEHIAVSAPTLASFIQQVQTETGASKVDLVGHSEGAFMALYVPKFEEGVASIIDHSFAIAPPTHGTTFAKLWSIAILLGNITETVVTNILDTFGCPACADLVTNGTAVERLNEGQITQPGITYTILISKDDELVTPPTTAFVDEPGVRNLYVQDFCPLDTVGHIGEAYDANVWAIVDNTLSGSDAGPEECSFGAPGR
ncbi:hypothetical protein LTR85_003687 [Meristemomyces frigidus]|nr:hypothetical protein LTR85_003687 [Meristemomyces frigidus]